MFLSCPEENQWHAARLSSQTHKLFISLSVCVCVCVCVCMCLTSLSGRSDLVSLSSVGHNASLHSRCCCIAVFFSCFHTFSKLCLFFSKTLHKSKNCTQNVKWSTAFKISQTHLKSKHLQTPLILIPVRFVCVTARTVCFMKLKQSQRLRIRVWFWQLSETVSQGQILCVSSWMHLCSF